MHTWTYFLKWEFLIITPSQIALVLGLVIFSPRVVVVVVVVVLLMCERCLVHGGESFRELDFIWDTLSLSLVGWQIVMEWTTMNDAMFIGKANGLWGPMFDDFFFLLSTWSTLLLGNVSAILLLWCCNFRGCQKCWLKTKPIVKLLPFPFGNLSTGAYNFFPFVLVSEHFLLKFHRECPFFFVIFFYTIMYKSIYYIPQEKRKVSNINHKHANS